MASDLQNKIIRAFNSLGPYDVHAPPDPRHNDLYIVEFPKSYNTYDSYAFALKQKGDYSESIKWYKKGLDVLAKYPELNKGGSIVKDSANAHKLISEMEEMIKNDS